MDGTFRLTQTPDSPAALSNLLPSAVSATACIQNQSRRRTQEDREQGGCPGATGKTVQLGEQQHAAG